MFRHTYRQYRRTSCRIEPCGVSEPVNSKNWCVVIFIIYNVNINPVTRSVIRDIELFWQQSEDFSKDISGVEQISMKPQREREQRLEEVSKEVYE
jgi:hypothetical protein